MEIDIYDFDKTIVPFDSGSLFILYCFLRYPYLILFAPVFLPIITIAMILMLTHVIHFTSFKKICFCFVMLIPLERAVRGFWDRHIDEVNEWFLRDKKRYSVIISASPDFLLEDIAKRLGFDKLICTRHNRKTGVIIGVNCRGEEKVKRLGEELDMEKVRVIDVYSDSYKHDRHIFSLATGDCYHIENKKKIKFNFNDIYKD